MADTLLPAAGKDCTGFEEVGVVAELSEAEAGSAAEEVFAVAAARQDVAGLHSHNWRIMRTVLGLDEAAVLMQQQQLQATEGYRQQLQRADGPVEQQRQPPNRQNNRAGQAGAAGVLEAEEAAEERMTAQKDSCSS